MPDIEDNSMSNPLEILLRERISTKGPLPFAEFMECCLYHPVYGYYMVDRHRIGREGDFFTSSSVHPLFGKLVAKQLLQMWELLGTPKDFIIVEQGAGDGHLCFDILDTLRKDAPEFYRNLQYHLIEVSPVARTRQVQLLAGHSSKVVWSEFDQLDGVVGCFLSNELIDAFPVHLIEKNNGELKEVYVSWSDNAFCEVLHPLSTPLLTEYFKSIDIDLHEGNRAEINLAALSWLQRVAKQLRRGFVLTVDYGYQASELYAPWRTTGTLMCYHRHTTSENPYERVGEQDMTSHVDFTSLIKTGEASGLTKIFFGEQCRFLLGLGFVEALLEAQALETDPNRALALRLTLKNLILPEDGMGEMFKVLVQGKEVGVPPLLCARSLSALSIPANSMF